MAAVLYIIFFRFYINKQSKIVLFWNFGVCNRMRPYRNIRSNISKTHIFYKIRKQGPGSAFTITKRTWILANESYFSYMGCHTWIIPANILKILCVWFFTFQQRQYVILSVSSSFRYLLWTKHKLRILNFTRLYCKESETNTIIKIRYTSNFSAISNLWVWFVLFF